MLDMIESTIKTYKIDTDTLPQDRVERSVYISKYIEKIRYELWRWYLYSWRHLKKRHILLLISSKDLWPFIKFDQEYTVLKFLFEL